MVARVQERDGRHVYRPLFARVLLVVAAAVVLWWDVDLLQRGRFGTAVLITLWLVAALAALGALFWRPAVVVDADGVELRNVLRDVRVPWAALERIETRFALTLLAGGRRHQSWAATANGRPGRARPSDVPSGEVATDAEPVPASGHVRTASGLTAYLVEQRWLAWQQQAAWASRTAEAPATAPGEPAAEVTVRWRPLLPAVALGAAAAAAVLTPFLA